MVIRDAQFWAEFEAQERDVARRLRGGLERCRRGKSWLHALRPAPVGSLGLYATELRHRLIFAAAVFRVVLDRFGVVSEGDEVSQDVFHVTLVSSRHVTTDEPDSLPIHPLRQWVSTALRGFSYIGVIEAALFVDRDQIHWHAHLLVWGCSKPELKRAAKRINQREEPLIEGAPNAHWRRVRPRELGTLLGYLLKSPINQYTALPPDYSVQKPKMSGRNLVRLYRVMRELHLDHLLIAGGEGSDLRRVIVDRLPRPPHRCGPGGRRRRL